METKMIKIRKETYDKIKEFSKNNYNMKLYAVIDLLVDNHLRMVINNEKK